MRLWFLAATLGSVAMADLASHVAACRAALGPIPAFRCDEGEPIPVTRNGDPVNESPANCDTPSLAAGVAGCYVGARVGKIVSGDVDWVFLCRRTSGPGGVHRFGPIALIGANRETGDTCFFDSNGNGSAEAPSPENDTGKFWGNETGASCVGCHANRQPWLHSPYLESTKAVPFVEAAKLASAGYRYRVIGVSKSSQFSVQPRKPDGTRDRTCTSCHAITTGFYGDNLVPLVLGDFEKIPFGHKTISAWAREFPRSHRMPLQHDAKTREEWETLYGAAVERLRHCLKSDDPERCFPREPGLR